MGRLPDGVLDQRPGIPRLQSPSHRRERREHGSKWAATVGARQGLPRLPKATKLRKRIAIWLPRSAAWSECTRKWGLLRSDKLRLGGKVLGCSLTLQGR